MEHCGNFFFENINPKHVQNTFGHFWERFRDFCNFENLLILWKHFEVSTLHGTLGKKNLLEKLPQNMFKTRLALGTFGNDFGHLWKFESFLIFWKHFEDGTLGKKNLSEKLPQNMFKTRLDTFGEHFWLFLEFWKIFDFWKHFEDSTLHGTLGKIIFWRNYPNTCSKCFWTIWERFWAFLQFWHFFKFFGNLSNTRPSIEHCAKKVFPKKYPKTCSKHFWTVWVRF